MRRLSRSFTTLLVALAVGACTGNAPAATSGQPSASSAGPATSPGPGTAGASRPPTAVPVATPVPLGDRLAATITVPQAPCAMAVDATWVWVTGSATNELVQIDPATNTVVHKIPIGGGPCGVAVGPDGRIWVALLGAGSVVAVDPKTLKITGRLDHVGPQLWDLKAGLGSIWVSDRSAHMLLRIDPTDATVTASIPIGPLSSGLAVVTAGVWVSDDTDGKLRRIDPATNKVATTIAAGGAPSWFADDAATTLLIAERGGSKVRSMDPSAGTLGDPSIGWNEPLDGTVVNGKAWIPEGSGRRVGVLDLATPGSEVVRYALPGAVNPFVAEPGFGDVWVLDFGSTAIWRIHP